MTVVAAAAFKANLNCDLPVLVVDHKRNPIPGRGRPTGRSKPPRPGLRASGSSTGKPRAERTQRMVVVGWPGDRDNQQTR